MENNSQTKLPSKKLNPINRKANWDERKKACIKQSQEEYPYIPEIAIEAMYDFSLKYENDETMEKYFKGETLNPKQLKKVDKILHPKGYKNAAKKYEKDEAFETVSIIRAEDLNKSKKLKKV